MKNLTKRFLMLAPVMLAGTMVMAQSEPAPMYPNDPHPAQAPNTGQDQAPQEIVTGQNQVKGHWRNLEFADFQVGHLRVDGRVTCAQ